MNVFHEAPHAGAYIAEEVSVNLSRRVVEIASGAGKLAPGTVLGKVTSSGQYVQFDPEADDGSQTACAILFDHVDATKQDVQAVVTVTLTAVNESELIWPEGISGQQLAAAINQLREADIVVLTAHPVLPSVGATTLNFLEYPEEAEAGDPAGPVVVEIVNDEGIRVIGDNTTQVSLTKKSGSGSITVDPSATVTAVNGVATFESVTFSAADDYVLTATASGLDSAETGEITVVSS